MACWAFTCRPSFGLLAHYIMDGYEIIVKHLAPFVKLKILNYEFGSSKITPTLDIVANREKTIKNVHAWNIP